MKSLSSMAIVWSGTDFGRLSRPDFMGGQLSRSYDEEFPEQVFAALSGRRTAVPGFRLPLHELREKRTSGSKFAQIARKTTFDASRIGRTLNHYDRCRARVAMLYPHTAHTWLSMGKYFNDDYLKMTGYSQQYLDRRLPFRPSSTFCGERSGMWILCLMSKFAAAI